MELAELISWTRLQIIWFSWDCGLGLNFMASAANANMFSFFFLIQLATLTKPYLQEQNDFEGRPKS